MIEFALWILLGSLTGWVGYLSARTGENHAKPYLLIGVAAAVAGGLLVRMIDHSAGIYSINMNSLVVAIMISAICMIALGFSGKLKSF